MAALKINIDYLTPPWPFLTSLRCQDKGSPSQVNTVVRMVRLSPCPLTGNTGCIPSSFNMPVTQDYSFKVCMQHIFYVKVCYKAVLKIYVPIQSFNMTAY